MSSSLSIQPFDLLKDQSTPYAGFGETLAPAQQRIHLFAQSAADARDRITKGFGRNLSEDSEIPAVLQNIIEEMWAHSWSPNGRNLNLFATDFGLVLTDHINRVYGGLLIFRSNTDLSHVSVWWPNGLEAFPFHHIFKSLLAREDNAPTVYVRAISNLYAEGPILDSTTEMH